MLGTVRSKKKKGKTYFEVPVFLLFSIFYSCIFILRQYILVLLFSYIFRPSQPQNRQPKFFFSVVDICTALGFPQLHISSSIAALPPSFSIFFLKFLKYKPYFFFSKELQTLVHNMLYFLFI